MDTDRARLALVKRAQRRDPRRRGGAAEAALGARAGHTGGGAGLRRRAGARRGDDAVGAAARGAARGRPGLVSAGAGPGAILDRASRLSGRLVALAAAGHRAAVLAAWHLARPRGQQCADVDAGQAVGRRGRRPAAELAWRLRRRLLRAAAGGGRLCRTRLTRRPGGGARGRRAGGVLAGDAVPDDAHQPVRALPAAAGARHGVPAHRAATRMGGAGRTAARVGADPSIPVPALRGGAGGGALECGYPAPGRVAAGRDAVPVRRLRRRGRTGAAGRAARRRRQGLCVLFDEPGVAALAAAVRGVRRQPAGAGWHRGPVRRVQLAWRRDGAAAARRCGGGRHETPLAAPGAGAGDRAGRAVPAVARQPGLRRSGQAARSRRQAVGRHLRLVPLVRTGVLAGRLRADAGWCCGGCRRCRAGPRCSPWRRTRAASRS